MQFSISSVNRRRWFSEEQAKREERAKCMQMCLGLCMLVHVRDFLDYFKITWKFFIWIFFNFSGQLCPVLSFFLSFDSCFYSPLLLLWLMFTHTWLRSYRCSSLPLFCIIRLFYNRNGASGISNKKKGNINLVTFSWSFVFSLNFPLKFWVTLSSHSCCFALVEQESSQDGSETVFLVCCVSSLEGCLDCVVWCGDHAFIFFSFFKDFICVLFIPNGKEVD